MGTDPGPDFANLFLHFYEFNFMEQNSRIQYSTCKKLNNSFRYIDDIASVNGDNIFETVYEQIYPEELSLKKENVSNTRATFLDLDIKVKNKNFEIGLYDKRNDFNFNIVNFPFLDGNIPLRQSLGVFLSQVIRYQRICTNFDTFMKETKRLIQKLKKQGYRAVSLEQTFQKVIPIVMGKYKVTEYRVQNTIQFN